LHYCGDGSKITSCVFHRQRNAHAMLLVQHIIPVFNIMQIYSVYINCLFKISYNYIYIYEYINNLTHEMKRLRYFLNYFIYNLRSHFETRFTL
jgi:hypothetical protein